MGYITINGNGFILPTGTTPTPPAPSGYEGVTLGPINTGYTNPFSGIVNNGTPTQGGTLIADTQNAGNTAREFLLTAILEIMPKTLGSKGVLFDRTDLDKPETVSDSDLQFVLALLENTPSYMGNLDLSNQLLFQKEVIDAIIRGTQPLAAVEAAKAGIKADIYLYDEYGQPLVPTVQANGQPYPATNTAAKKDNSTLILLGIGLLLILSSGKKSK
jgi:hypothetical protein